MAPPRFVIGIDLGTTNCVVAYLEVESTSYHPTVLPVLQWDTPESTVAQETLPSFNYLATPAERDRGFRNDRAGLPTAGSWIPGIYALQRMGDTPTRVIHSAKSWLCHGGIDRTAAILPWHSDEVPPEERLSPVEASSAYLAYMKECWNRAHTDGGTESAFDNQRVVITVPASFDEAAQQLTLEAARLAGYPQERISLIEEPQAAFYDWLGWGKHASILLDLLERTSERSARVLVCDIGGGTTDLSLFEIAADAKAPSGLALRRVAVSEHLLLGGDNIDLTLAHLFEQKLTGGQRKLAGRQWSQLLVQARELKERILSDEEPHPHPDPPLEREGTWGATFTLTLAGTGAGLFDSTLSATVTAAEVRETVLEGFFPRCAAHDRPRKKGGGLREWGLPYAEDTAVTRHLAAFLEGRTVQAILYNGGSVTPAFLRQRLTGLVASWQGGDAPVELHNDAMALAVARGAARYGQILHSPRTGDRITGGHAHALYLEVTGREKKVPSLICVLPKGMEANQSVRIESEEFDLLVNQSVRFQCYFSNRRLRDSAGEVVPWREDEFQPLPPLQTAIHLPTDRPKPPNNRVRVTLECSLNELGLLQLYCVERDGPGRWRLDFNLRRPVGEEEGGQAREATTPARELGEAVGLILSVYGKKRDPSLPEAKPRQLMRQLERSLGASRESWDSATLRGLWPAIAQGMTRRSRSVDHEESWLYLAGFALRPGYGFPLDESRIEELWRLFELGMAFPKEKRVQVQWYLLWRRTAGGLNAQRQMKILEAIFNKLPSRPETDEILYLAGSLERLPLDRKMQLVKVLSAGLTKPQTGNRVPYAWSLGRILSRVPLYGGPETIVAPSEVERLFRQLRELNWKDTDFAPLVPLFAQAARRTDQRGIDVTPEVREEIVRKMKESGARAEELQVVRETVPVKDADRVRQFGESLPSGLVLVKAKGT
ncbi:hsp70 family protein [Geomonas sp. RF6]|uniref:hsp70 family protein n=1 Tax=Geomonas sp. RF6 TaxID=2897342 RepID=UPI001E51E2C0|nr:hsp70 family protein [Geomonas sp. RF6]UFS70232.1 hsp70 family protein [Geomonas sp. RF6]